MKIEWISPSFEIIRNDARCTACGICVKQCANGAHTVNPHTGKIEADESVCVNCQRCVALCPARALKIIPSRNTLRSDPNWTSANITEIYKQAASGGVLLSSMGNPADYPVYWDKILINASQVTNPPIDPLREPMETRVSLGKKPLRIERNRNGKPVDNLPPQIRLNTPVLFSAMSYGSISYNAHAALARAAMRLGVCYNTGEGGLHRDFYPYGKHTIVQVASGRFGVHPVYLNAGAPIAAFTNVIVADPGAYTLVTPNQENLEKVVEQFPSLTITTIPAGTYSGIDFDVPALRTAISVCTPVDTPAAVTYELAKYAYENWGEIQNTHAALLETEPADLAEAPIPLHPGAAAFFRDAHHGDAHRQLLRQFARFHHPAHAARRRGYDQFRGAFPFRERLRHGDAAALRPRHVFGFVHTRARAGDFRKLL